MRLALKLLRGEPAISGFDWNFSPIHTSSPPFSTDVRSVLHCLLRQLQLSPGSIGISPLSTPHPHPFQRMCVRSSIAFYASFNLDMDRSPGFGSAHTDSGPIKTWFPYGSTPSVLNLASMHNSPDRSTKSTRFCLTLPACTTRRTVLQKVRGSSNNEVPQLVNTGFQVLFHSPPGVLFTLPSQYYTLSVTEEYLALRGGPPDFPQGSTCLAVLWILPSWSGFRVRGFHPLWPAFPKPFHYP